MPQFNETELTAAVVRSFEETPDPRVKFLMEELVKSLHDFVRKTDLTFDEWLYAIDFVTQVGQKCSPSRQEFILLSDVLGVSMLVDAVNHRERAGATETTVLGPFYVGEHKPMPHGTEIAPHLTGERMFVQARVTDLAGNRWRTRRWTSGMPTMTAIMIRKGRITRRKARRCERASSPTPRAGSISAPSCPAAIRFRPTVRSDR
jgi:hypothetical protein